MLPLLLEGEVEHFCRRWMKRWGRRVKFFFFHHYPNVGQVAEWLVSEAEGHVWGYE